MPRQTRKLKETKTSAKKGKDIVGNHLAIRSPGSWSRLNDGNLLNPTLLEGLHGVTVPLQLAVRNLRFNKYYTPLARLNPHKTDGSRLAQSPLKCGVDSGLSRTKYEKMANPLGDDAASFWPFQQPPILFPGIKKEFGTFPRSELIWSIIPMFIPFENYGASISTKNKNCRRCGASQFACRQKKRSNHPMSTSTLTSRLLFSKKKVGSKPTKSLHKTFFSPKKTEEFQYISATVNGKPPQAR